MTRASCTESGLRARLPEDPKLPQLPDVLDPARAAELLGGALPGKGLRVSYVRYKPSTNCIVLYEAEAANGDGPLFYLKVFAQDWMPGEFDRSRMLLWSPRQRVSLFEFPRDLEIPALEAVASPEAASAVFERALRRKYRGRIAPSGDAWEVVRYKPERRCVLRGSCVDRRRGRIGFYARFYAEGEGENAHRWYKQLGRGASGVRVPRTLGYSGTHRCLLLAELGGTPLSRFFAQPLRHLADAVDASARSLALWHRTPPPGGVPLLDPAADLLQGAAQPLEHLMPALSPMPSSVARRLIRAQPETPAPCLLHGDFYHDQVLLSSRLEARFVDLDELAVGNPLHDAATFCAHVRLIEAENGIDPRLADWICRRFVDSYGKAAGEPVARKDFSWHVSAALLRAAILPFRRANPLWRRLGRSLVRAAAQAAEEAL